MKRTEMQVLSLTQEIVRSSRRFGDRVAVVSGPSEFTWHECAERIARLAQVLLDNGIERDGRVGILGRNSHRFLEALYAAMWAGGVAVPLNWRLAPAELSEVVADCAPAILIADREFERAAAKLADAVPTIRTVIIADAGPAPHGMLAYEAELAAAVPVADAKRGGDDLACLFYTGGTTGRAKGVMLSHNNLCRNSSNVTEVIAFDNETVHLHCGPLFHLSAAWRLFIVTRHGGRHVILPKFVARDVFAAIREHRITAAAFVPTMIGALLDLPEFSAADVASLRVITYGASPISATLMQRLIDALPQCSLYQGYGMTETSPAVTFLTPEYHKAGDPKLRSTGKAVPNVRLRIADSDDHEVAPGVVGEIQVQGPTVMCGYWRQPALTETTLRGGWMHTGDAGFVDAEGFLFIVDRLKDMVVTGGENVYSSEVEHAIAAHPAVAACAVFGIPDAKWGEAVHAVVVPQPGCALTAQEIQAHCRLLIADYKCPKSVEVRTESLPLSAVNKVLKAKLKAKWWEGRDRAVS